MLVLGDTGDILLGCKVRVFIGNIDVMNAALPSSGRHANNCCVASLSCTTVSADLMRESAKRQEG
jgi:hypothetical protein